MMRLCPPRYTPKIREGPIYASQAFRVHLGWCNLKGYENWRLAKLTEGRP
jgi:hypothetical protein